MSHTVVPTEIIENKIFLIRGFKVMMDKDLAYLYEVKPIALRQQVKRNKDHFPDDFMFQLTQDEVDILVSHNVIPSRQSLGGFLPYAFTEQGIAMLSSVLKSKRAIYVNIAIMRAFVKLRELMITHQDLARKIEELLEEIPRALCALGLTPDIQNACYAGSCLGPHTWFLNMWGSRNSFAFCK